MDLRLLVALLVAGLVVELLIEARRAEKARTKWNKWVDFARSAIWLTIAILLVRFLIGR